MIKLRKFVDDNVLAIASNQQFCKLAIKECGNVACLNQFVATKSIIGIVRLYINNGKPTLVEEELKTRSLRESRYTIGRIKGERLMKNKTRGGMKNNIIKKVVKNLGIDEDVEK